MRRLIIDAHVFPRNYIRSSLYLLDCNHGGNFQNGDQHCDFCSQKEACRWLYSNDECSNMQSKSISELIRSLEFSLDYIDIEIANAGHNIGHCSCVTCLWLKNAENLLSLYQKTEGNRSSLIPPTINTH